MADRVEDRTLDLIITARDEAAKTFRDIQTALSALGGQKRALDNLTVED